MISMIPKQLMRRSIFSQFSICRSLMCVNRMETEFFRSEINSHSIENRRYLFLSKPSAGFLRNPFKNVKENNEVRRSSCLVYECLADSIDYVEFLKHFKMPDTFQSWFLAIALHVWMTICVTVSEKKGRFFRNALLEAMWNDIEERLNLLNKQGVKSSLKKQTLKDFVDELKAALVSYDEGIMSNDMVLSGAVWRMFFSYKEVDPRLLEDMVFYIRRQISHLDSLHMESLLKEGNINYLPLKQILEEKNNQT